MAAAPFGTVLRHLLQRMGARPTAQPSDAGLLARFAAERDEAAFAELVQRHGPMVLGVCRRILRDPHDADDAFQATFLVLARKAKGLDEQRPLGSWLYIVARNLALEHRASAARRRAREKEAAAMPTTEPRDAAAWREVCEVLDTELGRLPEKYRAPLVLCHLQGMTHEAAAQELGWPAGSLAKRLARGLELLRERLAGRGVALSATVLAALIGQNASAAVPPTLAGQLSRAAVLYAGGQATAGLVSTQATALAAGALHALALSRWKVAAALLLGIGFIGAGAGVFGHRSEKTDAAAAAPANEDMPPPEPVEHERLDQAIHRKLFTIAVLDKGIEANTPLKDVVEFLNDRYDLEIVVDGEAFAAAGVDNVHERFVSLPRVVLPLGTILRLLLRQIEPLDGRVSGYRVEKGALVIAPVLLENRAEERLPRGLPRGLPQRLFKPVRCDREPYGMSLVEALELYGKLYGQKLVLDRQAFADVGEREADKYPLAGRGQELPDEPCLMDVLDLIRWQVDGDNWKTYFHVRDGAIEITAAKVDSRRAENLMRHEEQVREYWSIWNENLRIDAYPRQPLWLDKGIDADAPLLDALEFLADRYGLTIIVDSKAFEAAGIDKVEERAVRLPVQKKPLPREELLRLLVEQVRGAEYTADCVYRRDGYFEVIPQHKQIRQKKPLETQHLDSLWNDLASHNDAHARLAEQTLVQAPRETLPYLRQHLKLAVPAPKQSDQARKLIADLESDQFAVRQRATEALERLGEDALPVLQARLTDSPPLEVRKRVERLLKKLALRPNAEQVRVLRCVRVLEGIGTAEARQLLETLAGGGPSPPSEAARMALKRLNR